MHAEQKTLSIVIPPVSDCFMPCLGAAQITAYLKQKGVATKLYDLGAELQTVILNKWDLLHKFIPSDDETSSLHRYIAATNSFFGEETQRFQLSYDNFISQWDWRNPAGLTDFLSAHKALFPFLEQLKSLPKIELSSYVAFSISFESQLIPAMLIAAKLKEQSNPTIIFGGSFFYNYTQDFLKLFTTLDLVDSVVIGPGELVLESIFRQGLSETAKSEHFSASFVAGKILLQLRKEVRCPVVYLPDFSDIDFTQYLSSVNAFPYMIRNTCYYGGCRFCNGDRDCGSVQVKDVKKAFLSISKIANACDIYNVYIVDAALSPRDFKEIIALDEPVRFSWIANARFEKFFNQNGLAKRLQKKGCRMLRFGLESGSQRVLDMMNKGTKVEIASSILQKLHVAGILTHIYLMFGFQGETNEDREKTLEFLKLNRTYIDSYSLSIFQPIPGTPVYEDVRTRLQLSESSDPDTEYQQILAEIYPSASGYKDILSAVEQVKLILSGFAHTNAEFYSANIFSGMQHNVRGEDAPNIQFMP